MLYFLIVGVIFFYIIQTLDYLNVIVPTFYFFIAILGGTTLVNLIMKNKTKASDYLIAMFLISISETIIGISFFVEKSMIYVPFYFAITYIGRYLLYRPMISKEI